MNQPIGCLLDVTNRLGIGLSVLSVLSFFCFAVQAETQRHVALPERTLPVMDTVDLVVVKKGYHAFIVEKVCGRGMG